MSYFLVERWIISHTCASEWSLIETLYLYLFRLSPAYYAHRIIQYLSRRDSIRQRSMRYQPNRMRASLENPASSPAQPIDGAEMDFDDFE